MNNNIFILLVFSACFSSGIYAQSCFSIDSVRVHYVPWNLKTNLSLSAYDIRNFKELDLHKTTLITDSLILSEFSHLIPLDESNKTSHLDIRMVLDIYYSIGLQMTVSIDPEGYYELFGKEYRRNIHFIKWINNYIIPFK